MLTTLPPFIQAAFREHAAKEHPKEACGLVVQLPGGALAFRACRNVHSTPLDCFELAPEDWDQVEDEGEVIALLHSHPDAPARPSLRDWAECAVMLIPWFILGQGNEWAHMDPSRVVFQRSPEECSR
ncbi:MAG: C40 family peptidase [Holophaga sp.]|jgi:proteasome lid subunit RPN8/RPN11